MWIRYPVSQENSRAPRNPIIKKYPKTDTKLDHDEYAINQLDSNSIQSSNLYEYLPPKSNNYGPPAVYGPPPAPIYGPPSVHAYGAPPVYEHVRPIYDRPPVGYPVPLYGHTSIEINPHSYNVPSTTTWLWEKIKAKFDLFTLGKILIKIILFKQFVKFVAIICLLLFLPKLQDKVDIDHDERRNFDAKCKHSLQFNFLY